MILIDGKQTAQEMRFELKGEISALKTKTGKTPGLAVVLVGSDPASSVYVKNKIKACEEVGINSYFIKKDENLTQLELENLIDELNNDKNVHGILVQLPLPKHLNEKSVINKIDVNKDVDGFSPYQMGKLVLGEPKLVACTPKGVMVMLKKYGIDICGKNAVVIGRSNIVGKPMFHLLLQENATVTIVHSKTKNLAEITKTADILVVAIGKANFVTSDMVKENAVVVDVGINRLENGTLVGDVDFESVSKKSSHITPVPGGVGPMTIVCLMANTLVAFKEQIKK